MCTVDDHHMCPYLEGEAIHLRIRESTTNQKVDPVIKALITRVFQPFTFSVVMVVLVKLPSLDQDTHVVLKLYDRRFAQGLRKNGKVSPWTPEIERQYQRFVDDGSASRFIASLPAEQGLGEEEEMNEDDEVDEWGAAQREADLYNRIQIMYRTEAEVYRRLQDVQGEDVPRLLSHVAVTSPDHSSNHGMTSIYKADCASNLYLEYLTHPGILLVYFAGFGLDEIKTRIPRNMWQSVCEDAIRIINVIGDREILNQDVKTRNFIVYPVHNRQCSLPRDKNDNNASDRTISQNTFKVVAIDFACCVFRGKDQSLQRWRLMQAHEDEEGAIGYIMQKRLKRGFTYRRSPKYESLDDDFMTE